MRAFLPLVLASAACAQNLSVVATVDGCCDLSARIERVDRPYLVLSVYETPLTVLELGSPAYGWFWSYVLPPVGVFRDGAVERVSMTQSATLRLPLDLIPVGVWTYRVGTVYGYSDVLTISVL